MEHGRGWGRLQRWGSGDRAEAGGAARSTCGKGTGRVCLGGGAMIRIQCRSSTEITQKRCLFVCF